MPGSVGGSTPTLALNRMPAGYTSPESEMALYGKLPGGKYRIVSVADDGKVVTAKGSHVVLGADVRLFSENIQADGTWLDAGNPANDLTVTEGTAPTRATYNSRNVLDFHSTQKGRIATASGVSIGYPATVAAAVFIRQPLGTTTYGYRGYSSGAVPLYVRMYYVNRQLNIGYFPELGSSQPCALNAPEVHIGVHNGISSKVRVGGAETAGETGDGDGDYGQLGNVPGLTQPVFDAWVGDFFLWKRVLTGREIENVEAWLKNRWGII